MEKGSFLLYTLSLILTFKTGCAVQECTKVENLSYVTCPDGFIQTPPPLTCVEFTSHRRSWRTARDLCHSDQRHTTMLQMYKRTWFDWFIGQRIRQRCWLGLHSPRHAGDAWEWSTGLPLGESNWDHGEPSIRSTVDRCAFMKMSEDDKWKDAVCSGTRCVACHHLHPLSPTKPSIRVNFHRHKHVYYGYRVNITCSALNAEDDQLDWVVSEDDKLESGILDAEYNTTTKHTIERHPVYGECMKKTISVFTFNASESLSYLKISCFSRRRVEKGICPTSANPITMCNAVKLHFIDGPRIRPIVKYSYNGAPGPVSQGDTVKVKCIVFPGKVGKLTWVVNFATGPGVLAQNDTKIIDLHEETDLTFGRKEISTLEFKMQRSLDGLSVSCYAHKFPGMKLSCLETDLFCVRLHKLSLSLKDRSARPKLLWFLFPIIVISSVVSLRMVCINIEDISFAGEGDENIGAYYD